MGWKTQTETGADSLDDAAGFLRARANRHAWFGLLLALGTLLIATLLAALVEHGDITIAGLLEVQQSNPALWFLDFMPLLFLIWGQYVGTVMSYQAGAMVLDETRALREQASLLEYRLGQAETPGQQLQLPGRHAFEAELNKAVSRRRLRGGGCAVLVISAEQFREVELSQGERIAQDLIEQLAQRLQNVLGAEEFLAHLGDDDFAVLQPRVADEGEPQRLAARIQLALDTPLTIARRATSLRLCIGIALHPAHGDDAATLLRQAETAKYAAAAAHLDHLVWQASLEDTRAEGPRLLAELHAALNHEGLADDYDLQLPLSSELAPRLRLAPYWLHPRRGRLEGADFLSRPRRNSLVHSLLLWLLREGLTRLSAWRELRADLGLVIRIPDGALEQLALADIVLRLLASHDLPAAALTLEVRERGLIGGGQAQRQLSRLREAGIGVCLTGLGAIGATPATALHYAISELRLSPDLIALAGHDSAALAVLESTAALAQRLQLRLVLAGIDDERCERLGRTLSAHYIEGREVRPRMQPDEVGLWLRRPSV